MILRHPIESLFILFVCITAPLNTIADIELLDRIVAIVDNRAITQSELEEKTEEILINARSSGVTLPSKTEIKKQVLDLLINETLQINAAKRFGLDPTDQEIDLAINNLLQQQKISRSQLEADLGKMGRSLNDYRRTIRRQLLIQQVSRGVVNSRIQISDQDIDSFLKSADAKFWASPDYNLGHIFLPVANSATFEETQAIEQKANDLFHKLISGANFEATAIAESKGAAALKGGDLGWRKTSALPTLFANVVPDLKEGQITKPLRSKAGFHILKLKGKKGDEKRMVTQSKVRHILLEPNELYNSTQTRDRLAEIRQEIIDGKSKFEDMAREHTDDIGSKLSGGDMGWSTPGIFVPEFESVMNGIEVGTVSEPFQTQFGWHILQVQERRNEDMTEEMLRARAGNIIRSRRFEDEVQLWVQEMRDGAFIDVRI